MTLAEVERAIKSYNRRKQAQQQEQASFDYTLADLIGRSVARIYNASNKLPSIAEAYSTLFNAEDLEEKKAIQQAELSALRFKQFANAHNMKYKGASNN